MQPARWPKRSIEAGQDRYIGVGRATGGGDHRHDCSGGRGGGGGGRGRGAMSGGNSVCGENARVDETTKVVVMAAARKFKEAHFENVMMVE